MTPIADSALRLHLRYLGGLYSVTPIADSALGLSWRSQKCDPYRRLLLRRRPGSGTRAPECDPYRTDWPRLVDPALGTKIRPELQSGLVPRIRSGAQDPSRAPRLHSPRGSGSGLRIRPGLQSVRPIAE